MPVPDDLVRLDTAGFRFRGSRAPVLRDVSLTVQEGDRILIRGPSGSGKSTLLLLLAGLAPEYVSGELTGGRDIFYSFKGVVLQNPEAQIVTPSVEEEIAFALENEGMDPAEIRPRVEEALDRLGLSHLAGRHPLTLSGGECQRVSLAAALARKPDILFLDEPTAYLDAESARRFFASLSLLPESTAVVVVEHDIRAAAAVCTASWEVTEDGRLERSDFRPPRGLRPFPPDPSEAPPGREGAPALEIRDLGHRFGKDGPVLFSGLTFSLRRGETAALLGPSGCGKTTILSRIARILPKGLGTVWFDGRETTALKDRDFNASFLYVPQNPEHMFVADTAGQELALSGGDPGPLARAFGLEGKLESNPFRLSEGEKRRLNLCVAFSEKRSIYLLDEPTYGLDDANRFLLTRDIRSLAERKAAILLVTHDAEFAACVADRIFILENGKLREREERDAAYRSA